MLKQQAVATLGHQSLLVPALVKSALAANDRLKLYLTLVQIAGQQARQPETPLGTWQGELASAGLDNAGWLRDLVKGAYLNDGVLILPHQERLAEALASDLNTMARPLCEGGLEGASQWSPRRDFWLRHLESLEADEGLEPETLALLTHGERHLGDSLHLFIMDMHKALNRVSHDMATEILEGAHVWQITDADRPLISAFMAGLQRTAPLKLSHPGLDTAVTRDGERLLIQNDIGTNDAHVLVIEVEGLNISLTYSDLHGSRFKFFGAMLEELGFTWQAFDPVTDSALNAGKPYHVGRARFNARDRTALLKALRESASRIVFVIDWNRARKQLQNFVSKAQARAILGKAAREEWGHMAWLHAGGKQLVFDAMQAVDNETFRVGDRLDDVLGESAARDYLTELLRIASAMALRQQPEALVADEARLLLLRTVRQRTSEFDRLAEHAAYCHALALGLLEALENSHDWDGRQADAHLLRAKGWERQADHLVMDARQRAQRQTRWLPMMQLLARADDIGDALEEAIFIHNMARETPDAMPSGETRDLLIQLADITLAAIQDHIKAVEIARHLGEGAERQDSEEFLQILWRILRAERICDDLSRKARRHMIRTLHQSPAALLVATDLATTIEQASDALLETGYALREMLFTRLEMLT